MEAIELVKKAMEMQAESQKAQNALVEKVLNSGKDKEKDTGGPYFHEIPDWAEYNRTSPSSAFFATS